MRNVLQRNNGNGTFSDIGCIASVYKTDWSWSGLLFDIDNNGYRDLHVTNGYRREVTDRDFIDFTLPEKLRRQDRANAFGISIPTFRIFWISCQPINCAIFVFKIMATGSLAMSQANG